MYRVLIVDDEPIVKIALKSIINWEEYGYTIVATASDGLEALDFAKKEAPDLIITDLKMPKMDGLTLINELNKLDYAGEILVISNYDDFDSVRSALVQGAANYILKVSIEAEPLKDILTDITERLHKKNQVLNITSASDSSSKNASSTQKSLFRNHLKDYLEAEDLPEDILNKDDLTSNIEFPCNFGLIHLKVKTDKSLDTKLLFDTIFESLNDIRGKDIIFVNSSLILVFFPMQEDSSPSNTAIMESIWTRLAQTLSMYMSIETDIAYSNLIETLSAFKTEYLHAKDLLSFCFYNPLGIINASSFTPRHYMDFAYYKDFAAEIQKNNNAKLEQTYTRIDELISLCAQKYVYPEILIKFFEKTLDMLEYLNPSHSAETHDYLDEQKDNIRTSMSARELYDIMTDSCSAIFAPITGLSLDNANNIRQDVKAALSYINKNCYRKISLDDIALYVGISPSYLSRIFKSETGLNITSYITKLKMEKAASLIKAAHSDTYLKEIALQVGIEDQLYFSRIFKKYYGISPSEYKNCN